MATKNPTRSILSPSKRKLIRQKQYRRKANLMRKACEYSKMCDADVCVGIRIRATGQIYILSADTSGFWAFLRTQLVCCYCILSLGLTMLTCQDSHYPTPSLITAQDLEKTDKRDRQVMKIWRVNWNAWDNKDVYTPTRKLVCGNISTLRRCTLQYGAHNIQIINQLTLPFLRSRFPRASCWLSIICVGA